jgi:hypothetical protein
VQVQSYTQERYLTCLSALDKGKDVLMDGSMVVWMGGSWRRPVARHRKKEGYPPSRLHSSSSPARIRKRKILEMHGESE